MFGYVVYKLTFPNGKIYVGIDTQRGGHNINYFGSWSNQLVEKDFTHRHLRDLTVRKEILFESDNIKEVRRLEGVFILNMHSNNPAIGYNQTHRKSYNPVPPIPNQCEVTP